MPSFKTKKLAIVGGPKEASFKEDIPYNDVKEVPGISPILGNAKEYSDLINFISSNLDKPRLCVQAVQNMIPGKIIKNDQGDILALHGFKVNQTIGKGKDGVTMVCNRYLDMVTDKKIPQYYLVKSLSTYGQAYNFMSLNFAANINSLPREAIPPELDIMSIKGDIHYRPLDTENQLYMESSGDEKVWLGHLSTIAGLNHWLLKNLNCCFWDLGYNNGKNYMVDKNKKLKWGDYGGAGIVYVSNKKSPKGIEWDIPHLTDPIVKSKENLVRANSKFLMAQFIFHMEHWHCLRQKRKNTNADIYSSITQVNTRVLQEVVDYVLPNTLQWERSKFVYETYKDYDWTDYITWKRIRDSINA